jgi:hypothetical protein
MYYYPGCLSLGVGGGGWGRGSGDTCGWGRPDISSFSCGGGRDAASFAAVFDPYMHIMTVSTSLPNQPTVAANMA